MKLDEGRPPLVYRFGLLVYYMRAELDLSNGADDIGRFVRRIDGSVRVRRLSFSL